MRHPLTQKTILKTFKNPCNVYHVKYMTRSGDLEEAREIIEDLLEDGIIEESKYAKGYYGLTEDGRDSV